MRECECTKKDKRKQINKKRQTGKQKINYTNTADTPAKEQRSVSEYTHKKETEK